MMSKWDELRTLWGQLSHLQEGLIILPEDAEVMEQIDKLLESDT